MPRSSRFNLLLSQIELTARERGVFEKHRKSVKSRLTRVFPAYHIETIGSYSRGSSVRAGSDIDLMLKLRAGERRWGDYRKSSVTVLNKVRLQLQGRFTATPVVRDKQAIVIHFSGGHRVDVVPAFYVGIGEHKNPLYAIPDGGGGWMNTSPQAHNRFIKGEDVRSGGKLLRVAKLIKYWRTRRTPHLALSSFHLELLLAESRVCVGIKRYEECLYEAFALLARRDCRAVRDPLGISGLVAPVKTEPQRVRAQRAASMAGDQIRRALLAEDKGKVHEADRLWHLVFKIPYRRR